MFESILAILAAVLSAVALWYRNRAKTSEVSVDLLLHENDLHQRTAATWKFLARTREEKIRELEREKAESDPNSVFDSVFPTKLPPKNDN